MNLFVFLSISRKIGIRNGVNLYFSCNALLMNATFKFLIVAFFLSLSGCAEHDTDNAYLAYKYWAGEKVPANVKVVNGKYWQSSHWTKEYVLYLELMAPGEWISEYIKQNHLIRDLSSREIPDQAPAWFKPDKHFRLFQNSSSLNSQYYLDSAGNHLFIYEQQF